MAFPTRENRNVLEHGLAAVAEAGGFYRRATAVLPRSLFTTSVAKASPSTSSAMISSGLPHFGRLFEQSSRSFIELIFFSWIRMLTSSRMHLHAFRIGDEIRRRGIRGQIAYLQPLRAWSPSFWIPHVMTPSLPTFFHGFGDDLPTCLSVLG